MRGKEYRSIALGILFAALLPFAVQAEGAGSGLWLRGGLGLDVMDLGVAVGAGAGYRFLRGPDTMEVTADIFYSSYGETYTEGFNTFDYSQSFTIVAVRANWFLSYAPGRKVLSPFLGAGFFVGNLSWENYNRTLDYTEGNSYTASGTILNLGLAYPFLPKAEARLEVPILIFFGSDQTASAISIPLTLGASIKL